MLHSNFFKNNIEHFIFGRLVNQVKSRANFIFFMRVIDL
jgi:hypothetical protein